MNTLLVSIRKTDNYKEKETKQKLGKKGYLERKQEERDAEQQIKDFKESREHPKVP